MRKPRRGLAEPEKPAAKRRQRDVLCDMLLGTPGREMWLTLDELANLTLYPQASISAQLRHLRKPENGGYLVEKRPRDSERELRGEDFGTVWEYRMHKPVRRRRRRTRRIAAKPKWQPGLRAAAC